MIEVHKGKHLKDGTTTIHFTQDSKPLTLEKDKRTPHPDFINAFAALDIHVAAMAPRLLRSEEIKRKKPKGQTYFSPEFEEKETADMFHCHGFTISDKGLVQLHGTVTDENSTMNYNTQGRSMTETELFGGYDYTDDLREKIKTIQMECELYIGGKVHPSSTEENEGDGATVKENTVTGIKGVGGKDETDVDPAQRLREVDETREKNKKRGKQQTPDNPAGK